MREDMLESPQSIIEIVASAPRCSHDASVRRSGEMLDDDALDRLCDAVLRDLTVE